MSKKEISMEKKPFTEKDTDLLTYELIPKTRRNVIYASLIFLLGIPLLPFFPAKNTHKMLVQSMSYNKSLLVSTVIVLLLISPLWYGVYRLKKDMQSGYKCVFRTPVAKKYWKSNSKFTIELVERPKGVKSRIELDKDEFYNWQKNDIIEINYLARSGEILSFEKINTPVLL